MSEIESALEEFGLNFKEIKVYLALLELGEATTIRLSEITKINRTTLYDLLNSLIDKGVVGSTLKEGVKYFYAAKPQTLAEILREKQNAVQNIIPLLIKKMGIVGKRPKIEFYEGNKGIDALHQDVLNNAKEIFAYGSYEITGKIAKYQSLDFRKKRTVLKIPLTAVTDKSAKEIEMLQQKEYRKLTKIYLDQELSQMPTWTYIYSNKIATLSFEREQFFGIIIESQSINQKERQIFNKIKEQAKKMS